MRVELLLILLLLLAIIINSISFNKSYSTSDKIYNFKN